MKHRTVIRILFLPILSSLISCGGLKRFRYLKLKLINGDTIDIRFDNYAGEGPRESYSFYFPEGVTKDDLIPVIQKESNWSVQYDENEIYFRIEKDGKQNYFRIQFDSDKNGSNFLTNCSVHVDPYGSSPEESGTLIIPYALLSTKEDYLVFFNTMYYLRVENIETTFATSGDYEGYKEFYDSTLQQKVQYDDEKKEIIFFQHVHFSFEKDKLNIR